jgi:hypothetical protein
VTPTSPPITGTFLDEITHDIPAQNWGPAERVRVPRALWLCWRLLQKLEAQA